MRSICVLAAVLLTSVSLVVDVALAQPRQIEVGRQCGNCGRAVPRASRVGQTCPHCRATWGFEETRNVGTILGQARSEVTLPVRSQPHMVDVYNIGVLDPMADRMRAQGQLLESIGNYYIKVAEAQLLQEEVERSRIRTRLEKIQHYYEVRRIRFEEKELNRDRVVESKKNAFNRRTDVLKELPVSTVAAAGGKAMNDILARITSTHLSEADLNVAPLRLPPGSLTDLRVEIGTGSTSAKFVLGKQADPYTFDPPSVLRRPPFYEALEDYREARDKLVEAVRADDKVDDETFDGAMDALKRLDELIDREFPTDRLRAVKSNKDPLYSGYREARGFTDDQFEQVSLLSVTEHFPTPFDGQTMRELVRYMKENGFRFAKADPGGENTYRAVYDALRDFYNAVTN